MKKILLLFLFFPVFSYGWTYPLKEVSKPIAACKYTPWANL